MALHTSEMGWKSASRNFVAGLTMFGTAALGVGAAAIGSASFEPAYAQSKTSKVTAPKPAFAPSAAEIAAYNDKMNRVLDVTDTVDPLKISKECAVNLAVFLKAINEFDAHPTFKPKVMMPLDEDYFIKAAKVASCQVPVEEIRKVGTVPQFAAYYLFAARGSFGPSPPSAIPVGEFAKKPLPARPDVVGAIEPGAVVARRAP